MSYVSQNPVTSIGTGAFVSWSKERLFISIDATHRAQQDWAATSFEERARRMTKAASLLRENRDTFARLICSEMGKLLREARAEVEKCALACDYYAVHAKPFLEEEAIRTDAGRSYVSYQPLGTIFAVMPWNFPFWQIFRFAAGALMAGNACMVKPASNVPQCGIAVESVFRQAGFPPALFTMTLIETSLVEAAIAHSLIHAVTLTGSETAGREVAALAGRHLKKCVLELGGSDAFIVLEDAELELAASQAVAARFLNCGQSCIAAKRFIVVPQVADEFVAQFKERVAALKVGDPTSDDTDLGPMARRDLRDELHLQVMDALDQGAIPVIGCQIVPGEGAFYAPSILDRVKPGMRAYHEEVFGPVATIIRARNEDDAIRIANDTSFGLGSSIWSRDPHRAEQLSLEIEAGSTFINGIVRSDPRLPFGGIKASGFGRELSYHGIREFTNAKTVWISNNYEGGERRQVPERRSGDRRQLGSNVYTLVK